MIIGIGTDLVSIDRIAAVLARYGDRFIQRVFAEEEYHRVVPAQAGTHQAKIQTPGGVDKWTPASAGVTIPLGVAAHYAKRWAAKEAVAKALGVGIDDGVYLRDIVVLKDVRGAPSINLRGGATVALQKRTEGQDARVHVSLSDDAGFALAFVVVDID